MNTSRLIAVIAIAFSPMMVQADNERSLIGQDAMAQGQLDWHSIASDRSTYKDQDLKRSEFAVFETGKSEQSYLPFGDRSEYLKQGQINPHVN